MQNSFIAKTQDTIKYLAIENTKKENIMSTINEFEFRSLPYGYESLEHFIAKQTVGIQYSKHHKSYYDNSINTIKGTEIESMDIKNIFMNISKYPLAVRNNGGGHFNHALYWYNMKAHEDDLPIEILNILWFCNLRTYL